MRKAYNSQNDTATDSCEGRLTIVYDFMRQRAAIQFLTFKEQENEVAAKGNVCAVPAMFFVSLTRKTCSAVFIFYTLQYFVKIKLSRNFKLCGKVWTINIIKDSYTLPFKVQGTLRLRSPIPKYTYIRFKGIFIQSLKMLASYKLISKR